MTTTINGATFTNIAFTILFAGYGHNNVTAHFTTPNGDAVQHTIKTSDTLMTDAMRSEDLDGGFYSSQEEANQEAAERVITAWIGHITEAEYNHYVHGVELPEEN